MDLVSVVARYYNWVCLSVPFVLGLCLISWIDPVLLGILNAPLTTFTTLVSLSSEINYHTGSDSTICSYWRRSMAHYRGEHDRRWSKFHRHGTKVCNPSQNNYPHRLWLPPTICTLFSSHSPRAVSFDTTDSTISNETILNLMTTVICAIPFWRLLLSQWDAVQSWRLTCEAGSVRFAIRQNGHTIK